MREYNAVVRDVCSEDHYAWKLWTTPRYARFNCNLNRWSTCLATSINVKISAALWNCRTHYKDTGFLRSRELRNLTAGPEQTKHLKPVNKARSSRAGHTCLIYLLKCAGVGAASQTAESYWACVFNGYVHNTRGRGSSTQRLSLGSFHAIISNHCRHTPPPLSHITPSPVPPRLPLQVNVKIFVKNTEWKWM